MTDRSLGAEEWRAILRALSDRLPAGKVWRIRMIGGVAMALSYEQPRTTTDADVINTEPEVFAAASAMAKDFGLSPRWMNADAEKMGYITPSAASDEGRVIFQTDNLEVRAPSVVHMLAMKVARLAGEKDINDAKLLLNKLGAFSDVQDVWSQIGGLIPVASAEQAMHNLEDLWELIHESP